MANYWLGTQRGHLEHQSDGTNHNGLWQEPSLELRVEDMIAQWFVTHSNNHGVSMAWELTQGHRRKSTSWLRLIGETASDSHQPKQGLCLTGKSKLGIVLISAFKGRQRKVVASSRREGRGSSSTVLFALQTARKDVEDWAAAPLSDGFKTDCATEAEAALLIWKEVKRHEREVHLPLLHPENTPPA